MSVWAESETSTTVFTSLVPLRSPMQRVVARLAYRIRLPLALSGGLMGALTVFLALAPAPPVAVLIEGDTDVGAGVWTRQPEAAPLLTVGSPAPGGLPASVAAWSRIHKGSVESEERLTLGDVDRSEPFVLAIVTRRLESDLAPASLFLSTARHAADAGLAIGRFSPIIDETGGHGMIELGRVSLARAVGFGPVRNGCLAWRTGRGDGTLRVEGIACLPADRPEMNRIACLLRDLAGGATSAEPSLRRSLIDAAGTDEAACKSATPVATAPARNLRVARTRQ